MQLAVLPFNGMFIVGTHEEDPGTQGGYFYIMGVAKRDTITNHEYYYYGRKSSFSNEHNKQL
ncbi:MAG TPA: hypothetical protein VJL79_00475 [Nitrososphaera sp.]|nr:hypothetical protein [Nitrososphaera sp.]